MIIHDLDVVSVALSPHETDPPLIVDSNAMLTLTVAVKLLQAVAGRDAQVLQRLCVVQHGHLATRGALDILKTRAAPAVEERFRVFAAERLYHLSTLLRLT